MEPSAVTTGGLVLDIAGALILALGLVVKTPEATLEEATPNWNFNASLDASLASQTADAQVGAALLVAGFAAQIAGALGWHVEGWSATAVALVISVAIAAGALSFLRRWWRPRSVKNMLYARLRSAEVGVWSAILISYGALLGDPPLGEGEVIAEFATRIIGRQRWDALTTGIDPAVLIPYTRQRRDIPGTREYEEAKHDQAPVRRQT